MSIAEARRAYIRDEEIAVIRAALGTPPGSRYLRFERVYFIEKGLRAYGEVAAAEHLLRLYDPESSDYIRRGQGDGH